MDVRAGNRVVGSLRRRCFPPVVVMAVALGAPGFAPTSLQGQAALDRPAGLNVQRAGLEQALRLLRRSAGVALVYSPDLIPVDRTVTCDCENLTVRRALERILTGTGLTFRGSQRQIRIVPAASPSPEALTGVVAGVVRGSEGDPIPGAVIQLDDGRRVFSDGGGAFRVADVRPGAYRVTVTSLGWQTRVIEGLEVEAGDTVQLTLVLEAQVISLADIVVAPGRFSALEDVPPRAVQVLTREEILTMPQVGEDVFRSMKRLPGVAAHDISTKLHVRGGADREVLVRLDGIDLYEPYHMKDWDGALGIVDLNALGGVELSAGGFGVEYGDRMAGVFDMRSRTSVGSTRTTLGMSITNLTAMSRGGFAGDRGSWLASARRGFMGLVIRLIGEDKRLSPQYWDVFGKVSYEPGPGHLITAHVLHAGDAFGLHGVDGIDEADVSTDWKSTYGWVTWESALHDLVSSDLTVWSGRVTRSRAGLFADAGRPGMPHRITAADDRVYRFTGAREELGIEVTDAVVLKLGAEARRQDAVYSYAGSTWTETLDENLVPAVEVDSTTVETEPDGRQAAAWAAVRTRPWAPLTVEVGARYDRATHSGDEDLAPRAFASLDLDHATTVRGSWGWYNQVHGIQELEVGDGEVEFHPAERTEQVSVGVERRFGSGIAARVEAYHRTVEDQRARYLNLEQELEVFPEAEGDRLRIDPARGRARGLELLVERRNAGRWAWSASYVLSTAEDQVPHLLAADCADGQGCSNSLWIPRRFDQRHAVVLLASYSPTPRWNLSVGWRYHSGWPATAWSYRVELLESGRAFWIRQFGPVRELRLPAYHRLDLRVTREFRVRGNPLTAFVDLFNVYDRTNLASYEFGGTYIDGQVVMQRREGQTMLPLLPTFGLRYEF
jgi:hypothetical protein